MYVYVYVCIYIYIYIPEEGDFVAVLRAGLLTTPNPAANEDQGQSLSFLQNIQGG